MKTRMFWVVVCFPFLLFSPIAHADEKGPSYSIGLGVSSVYIEEQISNERLTGGLTALPFYSQVSTGYTLNDEYRVAVLISHNWFVDADSMIVASGLLGLSATYSPHDFHNTYLKAGIGLAMKNRFSTSEMATGYGYTVGFGKRMTNKLSLEVSLQSLAFDEIAIDPDPDVSEDISSVQLSLVLLTF